MAELLRTDGLTKRFRGLVANEDIDFTLEAGAIHCIIGPNGAGKTTFLSMISGHVAPTAGRIFYQDRDITGATIAERARIGIGRKFQTPTVFENLTAWQNIELAVLRPNGPSAEREGKIAEVLAAIRLTEEADTLVRHMSHGQRQWLEIGLLLGNESELLLLDEPTAGMTAEETAATDGLVRRLARERSLSIIIIEHDINFIRNLRAPVTVLHLGRILKQGPFDLIAADEQVREVYLGS
jgi:ABC-type uncharacterized transport system ATPase subunit